MVAAAADPGRAAWESPVLGRHHATIRRLRALRRDAALRHAEGVLVAEGVHLVLEALDCGAEIELVLSAPALDGHADAARLHDALGRANVPHERTTDDLVRAVQDARGAQPVLAIVRRPRAAIETIVGGPAPLIVGLVGVQDPANLGAVLRSAAAAGASGCLCAETADPYHPRAVRAAMGATFRLPLVELDASAWPDRARAAGMALVVADPRGDVPYDRCDLRRGCLIVIGGEGAGVPDALVAAADARVRIALRAGVESLAVPAAAAVLLFEAARQRDVAVRSPRGGG